MFRKFILFSSSVFISLLICEALLRIFLPQNIGGYLMHQNKSGLWILKNNYRIWAKNLFDQALDEKPWYGLEQEYFLMNLETNKNSNNVFRILMKTI